MKNRWDAGATVLGSTPIGLGSTPTRHAFVGVVLSALLAAAMPLMASDAEPSADKAAPADWPRIDLSRPLIAFVALVDGQWDLFAWEPAGHKAPHRLTHTPCDEVRPSLSGDRAFLVYETTDGRLHRLDLKTGETTRLPAASDQHHDMQPAVSPDGKQVLMATALSRKADDTDLALMTLSSEHRVQRLDLPAPQFQPSWSRDQTHMAFVNLHARGWVAHVTTEIWIARFENPATWQLTLMDSMTSDPSFSPDGKRIVFASNQAGQYEIYSVDVKTRAVKQLTHDPAADTDPVYNPEGGEILFVSTRGQQLGLWLMREDKPGATALTPFGNGSTRCKDPDWR